MRAFDFWIMMLCCLCWGGNFVVSAWALGGTSVPPFMLAATRALLVLIPLGVFLFRPLPKQFVRLLVACMCVGPIHLGFLYTGLQTASASGASIISQSLIPIATILSVVWLKEKIGWPRGVAIVGALIGVGIMLYEPGALTFDIGLLYVLSAYVSLAVGTVVIRRIRDIDWRVYIAWMGLLVLIACTAASVIFERDQADVWNMDKGPLLIAAGYAAVCVSVFAHGQYFRLLQTYSVDRVVPLTVMVTFFATGLGVSLLGDILYPRYIIGAALILPCVWFIARRGEIRPVEIE